MKRAKALSNHQAEVLLPEPEKEVKKYSEEQISLIDKLIKLNVSKITVESLIKSNDQKLIKKWIEAVNYSNAANQAAYLVKVIREKWQFPEEYLKEKDSAVRREGEIKNKVIQEKEKEEENLKLNQIYKSLDPLKQGAIQTEAENRLGDFWKSQLNKQNPKEYYQRYYKSP